MTNLDIQLIVCMYCRFFFQKMTRVLMRDVHSSSPPVCFTSPYPVVLFWRLALLLHILPHWSGQQEGGGCFPFVVFLRFIIIVEDYTKSGHRATHLR